MRVFIVAVEANGVPKTYDGMWFHILAVFSKREHAEQFYWEVIESGEWGEYEVVDGKQTDVPTFDSNWQVEIYEQDVVDQATHFEKEVKDNA